MAQTPATDESLVEAIMRLYGTRRSGDFTDETILGSDINRIRHLFYFLRSEEVNFGLTYMTDNYRAMVHNVEGNYAVLNVENFEEGSLRRCRIKLEAFNELYQFEVPITNIAPGQVTIRIPAYIQSAQRRTNPRIRVEDIFMRFNVLYQPMFGRRGAGQFVESRYPEILVELRRDEPNMRLLNRIITEEVRAISEDFEILFYKDERPTKFMDEMLLDMGRTIYVRDCTNAASYYEPQSLYGLANYQKEFARLSRQSEESEAIEKFEEIRQEDSRSFLQNYVCAPLKIFNSVVGRLYVYSSSLDKKVISFEEAHRIDLLSQLLNYAMSKTTVARSYFRHSLTKVVNVSLTGLLFELNDDVLFDYLTFHDRLRIILQLRHHTLQLTGEISRYYPTEDGYHIGVNFFKANPDDYKVLEEFIYSRSRSHFG